VLKGAEKDHCKPTPEQRKTSSVVKEKRYEKLEDVEK